MSDHTGAERGEGQVDRVCHDEQMTIWTGEIVDSLSMGGYFRERLSYDDGLHIHAVIAQDLRSIIASAFLQAEPPAQCDEPPQGRDRNGLGGDSPAGAVAEGQAPNNTMSMLTAHLGSGDAVSEIPALKAEIERLKEQRRLMKRGIRAVRALARGRQRKLDAAEAALAESERKRVEVMRAFGLALAFADRAAGEGLVFGATSKQPEIDAVDVCLLAEEVLGFGHEDARWAALIAPTQETPHVES